MDVINSLSPSSVRKIILEEHGQLRRKLANIESTYGTKNPIALINAVQEMLYFFLKHIDQEEKILRPVLKDIDAWGGVRVDKMNKEHAMQRQEVAFILNAIKLGKHAEVETLAKKFVAELLIDMDSEEKECLSADLLKDDPITSSNYSG